MKTFDEALEIIAKECKLSPNNIKEYREFRDYILDATERYRGIIEEARDNSVVQRLLYIWMISATERDLSIDCILSSYFNSFVAGIVVGIEMTRTDSFEGGL